MAVIETKPRPTSVKYTLFIQDTLNGRATPLVILTMITLAFSGCSGGNLFDIDKPTVVAEHSVASIDVMTIHAPDLSFKGSTGDDDEEADVVLRARVDTKKPVTYYLEVKSAYEGHWRNYLRAVDEDGTNFQGSATENHVRCELFCWFHDTVEIVIPSEYLLSKQDKGMSFRLVGPAVKSGLSLILPADYIRAFLSRVASAHK
jgi:hypothetical protein